MNLAGYLLTMFLLVMTPAVSAGDKASALTAADFSVSGIADGMSADTVLEVIFEPIVVRR